MSQRTFYIIQIISTFSVLPAIALGTLAVKRTSFPVVLFLCFSFFGFIVDLLGWYFYLTNNSTANQVARYVYILIECSFYFWFVGTFLSNKMTGILFKKAWIAVLPLWILVIYAEQVPGFSVVFQVTISFALSYCLIQHVESEEKVMQQLIFWLLLGSFFYYFCTFFFMNFLYTQFGLNLWYVRNIVSIITNLMFAWGFYVNLRYSASR